jgi:hypothetical protein
MDSGDYYINLFINSTHSNLVSYTIKQNESIITNIQQECFYTASKNDPFRHFPTAKDHAEQPEI